MTRPAHARCSIRDDAGLETLETVLMRDKVMKMEQVIFKLAALPSEKADTYQAVRQRLPRLDAGGVLVVR